VLAWSWWRRCHQGSASYSHTKRRRDLLANPGWVLTPSPFGFVLNKARFPNFQEISWKCQSSRIFVSSCLPSFLSSKGVLSMTLLPVSLRGSSAWHSSQDPPPLARNQANVPLAAHPTDARIKCVMEEHLQQVASLHSRPFQASGLLDAASPPLVPTQVQALSVSEKEREPASTACSLPISHMHEADQIQRLAYLETKMVTPESADGPTHAGTAPGAGAIGRASPHHSGVPHATAYGKADAQSVGERRLDKILLV
jgi:hypothetical protein